MDFPLGYAFRSPKEVAEQRERHAQRQSNPLEPPQSTTRQSRTIERPSTAPTSKHRSISVGSKKASMQASSTSLASQSTDHVHPRGNRPSNVSTSSSQSTGQTSTSTPQVSQSNNGFDLQSSIHDLVRKSGRAASSSLDLSIADREGALAFADLGVMQVHHPTSESVGIENKSIMEDILSFSVNSTKPLEGTSIGVNATSGGGSTTSWLSNKHREGTIMLERLVGTSSPPDTAPSTPKRFPASTPLLRPDSANSGSVLTHSSSTTTTPHKRNSKFFNTSTSSTPPPPLPGSELYPSPTSNHSAHMNRSSMSIDHRSFHPPDTHVSDKRAGSSARASVVHHEYETMKVPQPVHPVGEYDELRELIREEEVRIKPIGLAKLYDPKVELTSEQKAMLQDYRFFRHSLRGDNKIELQHSYHPTNVPYWLGYGHDFSNHEAMLLSMRFEALGSLSYSYLNLPPSEYQSKMEKPQIPKSVLDLGSGTGMWCIEMAQNEGWEETGFVGMDVAPSLPTSLLPEAVKGRIEFVQANFLEALPFGDESFDFVHVSNAAQSIPENKWPDVLEEICRVLKPGGVFEMWELNMNKFNIDESAWFDVWKGQSGVRELESLKELTEMADEIMRKRSTGMISYPLPASRISKEDIREYSKKLDATAANAKLYGDKHKDGEGYDVVNWDDLISRRVYSCHYADFFVSLYHSVINESHLPSSERCRFIKDLASGQAMWHLHSAFSVLLSERLGWNCEMDEEILHRLEREIPIMKEKVRNVQEENFDGIPIVGGGSKGQVEKWVRDAEAELQAVKARLDGAEFSLVSTSMEMQGFAARKAI